MPIACPTDGPVFTKRHFVSLVRFRNSLSSIYDILPSKSSILLKPSFIARSHRLSVTALTNLTATERPVPSMHTLTQTCHGHGMWGMHPPHQRMICIHSVGWASHSGARPQGFKICSSNPPTTLKLAITAPCILLHWVKGNNIFGDADEARPLGPITRPRLRIPAHSDVPESGGRGYEVYMIILSPFKGKVLVWSTQERDAFTAGGPPHCRGILTPFYCPLSVIYIRTK